MTQSCSFFVKHWSDPFLEYPICLMWTWNNCNLKAEWHSTKMPPSFFIGPFVPARTWVFGEISSPRRIVEGYNAMVPKLGSIKNLSHLRSLSSLKCSYLLLLLMLFFPYSKIIDFGFVRCLTYANDKALASDKGSFYEKALASDKSSFGVCCTTSQSMEKK